MLIKYFFFFLFTDTGHLNIDLTSDRTGVFVIVVIVFVWEKTYYCSLWSTTILSTENVTLVFEGTKERREEWRRCGCCDYQPPFIKASPESRDSIFSSSSKHRCRKKRTFQDGFGYVVGEVLLVSIQLRFCGKLFFWKLLCAVTVQNCFGESVININC